jgi:hypothetical protein
MTILNAQNVFTGSIISALSSKRYVLNRMQLDSISMRVKERVNRELGRKVVSGVGDELIGSTFEIIRGRFERLIIENRTLYEQIEDKVIDTIARDVTSFYNHEETESKRTVWVKVDRDTSRNVNGNGMINERGVYGSEVALRF